MSQSGNDAQRRVDFHMRFNKHVSAAVRDNMPSNTEEPVVGLTFWMKDKVNTKFIRLNKSFVVDEAKFKKIVEILNDGLSKPVNVEYILPQKERKDKKDKKE